MLGGGPTASSTCEPTTSGAPVGAVDADGDSPSAVGEAGCTSASVRIAMPSRLEDRRGSPSETSSSSRPISRGAFSTTVTSAAEAAIHLREFEPDIAAADDDQMARQRVERQHRACWSGYGDLVDARHVAAPTARPPTLRKIFGAVSSSSPTRTVSRPLEARMAADRTVQPVHAVAASFDAGAGVVRAPRPCAAFDAFACRRRPAPPTSRHNRRRAGPDARHRRWRPASWSACSRC